MSTSIKRSITWVNYLLLLFNLHYVVFEFNNYLFFISTETRRAENMFDDEGEEEEEKDDKEDGDD